MDAKELEALDVLYYSLVDVNGGVLSPPFPVVHDQLFCLAQFEGVVVVLSPHCQVSDLLPVGCLIVVSDLAYHHCVIGKRNDGVGIVPDHAVIGEQGSTGGD